MSRTNSKRLTAACYGTTAVASVVMGLLYLLSQEFMPYHADALNLEWNSLSPELQVLLLALMRVAGGGFLCIAIVVAFLIWFPFREGRTWARVALPITILVVYIPTLIATLSVTANTPATAPWYGPAMSVIFTLVGALIDWCGNSSDDIQTS